MPEMQLTTSGDGSYGRLQLGISAKLWRLLIAEAAREGVEPAVYVREAIISRLHYDRGVRERDDQRGAEPVTAICARRRAPPSRSRGHGTEGGR